jgi:chemotaxis receptor (MCP) glutamine deamidase CheD
MRLDHALAPAAQSRWHVPFHPAKAPGQKVKRKRPGRALCQHEARRYGTTIQDYEAKIFGGGNMIRSEGQDIDDSIGTKNSVAAMQLLMQENVNILVAHVGEFGHRRIVFDSGTGEVWVRHIAKGAQRINSINGVI